MKEYKFDAVKTKDEVVLWIREFFEENGRDCNAVIGISEKTVQLRQHYA